MRIIKIWTRKADEEDNKGATEDGTQIVIPRKSSVAVKCCKRSTTVLGENT